MTYLTLTGCFAGAIEAIRVIRPVVNELPCLHVTEEGETKPANKRAEQERKRRKTQRELYMELSRYYWRTSGLWNQSQLLKKGEDDVFDVLATFRLLTFPSVVKDLEHPVLRHAPGVPTPGVEEGPGLSWIPIDTKLFFPIDVRAE